MKKLLAALFLAFPLCADQVAVSNFKGGLNNNNNPATINQDTAQDLLNVDITPGGLSIKKRSGYGVYKALATGQGMHGGYHAFNSTGDDYQIWGSSRSLYGIVADGTPNQLVSSATLNSTWDCSDTQGSSYCVDSSRDVYLKTDGATKTWYSSPLGTMVEVTPDRVVVAGVSGSPNTLFVSQSNTFTNFVTGINDTDAFTEVIASQGSKLTHIRWGCGKLLWWKDQSFGYFDFDTQYNAQVKTVSDTIGTFDNTSAVDPGGNVWFRGQDGHTWKYDCSSLSKESVDITPLVQASGKRTTNLWTQTTQADWQAGRIIPTNNLSATISVGDLIVSSFTAVEASSAQWASGTVNSLTVNPSSITLALNNSGTATNPSFESAFTGNWVSTPTTSGSALWSRNTSAGNACTISPQSGSFAAFFSDSFSGGTPNMEFRITDANGAVLNTSTYAALTGCSWTQRTVSVPSLTGRRVKFEIRALTASNGNATLGTSDSYIFGGSVSFYQAGTTFSPPGTQVYGVDNIQNGSSTITSGSFTSQVYNTGFSSSVIQATQYSYSANTSTPTITVYSATAAAGPWTSLSTSTGTNAYANQYVRYVATVTVSSSDNALTSISGVTLVSRSTGTFYSQIKNAPNITAWSTFGASTQLNDGTQTFYMRSSTTSFTVLSATPSWTAQSNGGLISISTGTFFQVRDDFAITAATQTNTMNDFTVNWFEGSATDQAYMLYFDNAVWQSVAYGAGQSTNNYIFRKDLINDAWTIYNFGAGGLLVQANRLYFGDVLAGNVDNFGTGTSDNGATINAYWKSKEFAGADPFLQNSLTNIDTFAKKDQGTTLTASYTVETSSTTSYSISLSSTTQTLVQSRKLLPSGKMGYTFNMQYGDTSASSAFEILGFRIGFTQNPYRPAN